MIPKGITGVAVETFDGKFGRRAVIWPRYFLEAENFFSNCFCCLR